MIALGRSAKEPFARLLILAWVYFFGALYTLLLVDPEASGRPMIADGLILDDAIRYFDASRFFDPAEALASRSDLGGFTNVGLYGLGYLARMTFPWAPYFLIYTLNFGLLLVTIGNVERIAKILEVKIGNLAIAAIALNPFLLLNLIGLTKEAWGLLLLSGFARFSLERKMAPLIALGAIAIFFRDVFLLVGLAVAFATYTRVRLLWCLAAIGLVFGVAATFFQLDAVITFRTSKSADLQAQTAAIMAQLGQLQVYPFGHLVASPIVLAINVLSPMLNPRQYSLPEGDFFGRAATISSWMFVITIAWGIWRRWRVGGPDPAWIVMRQLLMGSFVMTLYPFSSHRYYLPFFPVLVLWALGTWPAKTTGDTGGKVEGAPVTPGKPGADTVPRDLSPSPSAAP